MIIQICQQTINRNLKNFDLGQDLVGRYCNMYEDVLKKFITYCLVLVRMVDRQVYWEDRESRIGHSHRNLVDQDMHL